LTGVADAWLLFPAFPSPGLVTIALTFSSTIKTTFEVTYYDDRLPVITSLDPTTGKSTGGTSLRLTVANFPIMTSANEATVNFGLSSDASFGKILSILSSSSEATSLVVQTPSYPATIASGSVQVLVSITSVSNTNKKASSIFTYQKLLPSLESASPRRGSSFGGTDVRITLLNFPAGTTASGVVVELDNTAVPASLIKVPLSDDERTQVVLTTPPAAPGTVTGRVYLRALGRGSSETLKFDYTFIDASLPSMEQPVPRFACIARASVQQAFSVSLLSDLSLPSNATQPLPTLSFVAENAVDYAWAIKTYTASTPTKPASIVASISTSAGALATVQTGAIKIQAGARSVSFAFELRDCAVVAVVSATPSKGVLLGGALVQVRVAYGLLVYELLVYAALRY
jgi:hypothetical protein